jgi:hypothetical protein
MPTNCPGFFCSTQIGLMDRQSVGSPGPLCARGMGDEVADTEASTLGLLLGHQGKYFPFGLGESDC